MRERFETEYGRLFDEYGMGSTIWSPLCGGILSGKYNDSIPEGTRLSNDDSKFLYWDRFFDPAVMPQR